PLAAPRREDDVACREALGGAPVRDHLHSPAREPADALLVRDLVLPEEEPDALRLPVRHLTAPGEDPLPVDADVVREDAAAAARLHLGEEGGVGEDGLRRDAAPVPADATRPVALDDRGPEPELRGADRRHVPARPGAEDDDVVVARRGVHSTSA